MSDLTKRQNKIMAAIMKEYIKRAKPVSSKRLTQKYNLGFSPATIRNEMKELEKMKYLKQPHTSAGRVPTEKAYRSYIKSIQEKEIEIPVKTKEREPEKAFKEITDKLAELSGGFAFGGIKEMDSFYQSGFSNLLREAFSEDEEIYKEITKIMEEFEKNFNSLFQQVEEDETRIFIGREDPFKKTKNLSIIISSCKMPKQKHGLLGIMGPMRMRYDYNLSLLNKLKKIIEEYE
ncbi:MAG: hypothetical protein GF387_02220 [Candidatus Portnoybacteria bacterium]|nr:hypothetical protein [Candidatus Portnoybacteria bacterium]